MVVYDGKTLVDFRSNKDIYKYIESNPPVDEENKLIL
jgi:hypothetical protein